MYELSMRTTARLRPARPSEIVVRSPIVMNGYWKQPHATADAVRDGWLHTGDMGTMDERGFVWLKDCAKDVIISGGSEYLPS